MGKSIKEKYLIDPSKIMIPDENLGTFIEGYQEFAFFNKNRVLIYENGFIVQEVRFKEILEEYVFNYSGLKEISVTKTRIYKENYHSRVYQETSVEVNARGVDKQEYEVAKGLYKDEHEKKADHGFIGCVVDAIMERWNPIALQRFNDEFAQKGYGTFRSDLSNIEISRNYIKVDDRVIESPFRYGLSEGILYIYPQIDDNAHFQQKIGPMEINIAEMYNKDVFLLAANQLLGINWK